MVRHEPIDDGALVFSNPVSERRLDAAEPAAA
jgi:hypothetical protein